MSPGPESEKASLVEDVDQQQQTEQPTQMETATAAAITDQDQTPEGVQTPAERQGEHQPLKAERAIQPQSGEARPIEEVPGPSRPKKCEVTKVDMA